MEALDIDEQLENEELRAAKVMSQPQNVEEPENIEEFLEDKR